MINRVILDIRKNGLFTTARKIKRKIDEEKKYRLWRKKNEPDDNLLEQQKRCIFKVKHKFSIVVPVYRTNAEYLRAMIDSIKVQTYSEWELCIVDASEYKSGENKETINIIEKYLADDKRIKFRVLEKNHGISENTNAAIEMATGDFIVFADHDDMLAPDALFECAKLLENEPDADIIYSDEDKIDSAGNKHFQPYFKPDFNIDLLRANNYICHLFIVRMSIVKQVGFLNPDLDGAQDYDYILRCVEKTDSIYHIPKMLYHWRCHENSTSENPESKLYAYKAGKKALEDHIKRKKIDAMVVEGPYHGTYHIIYKYGEMVPITIIVVGDRIYDKACMDSIECSSKYVNKNYLFIETKEQIKEIVKDIQTDYIWIINNRYKVMSFKCIEEILGYITRPEVGAVGAKICKKKYILQAGIDIEPDGNKTYPYKGYGRFEAGSFNRLVSTIDCFSVSLDCVMMEKKILLCVLNYEIDRNESDLETILGKTLKKEKKYAVYNPYIEVEEQ